MKKLLTIICGGVVCTAMVQGGVIGCVNPDRDLVLRTLKNFGRNNPLKIEWVNKKKVKASEPDVSKKIRGALIEHGVPKQIAEMAPDISFGEEVLKPGQAVAVTATYKCKKVSIFVQEESQKAGVLRALKQFSDKQPVTIDWVGDNAKASDPLVSKAIRDWLQKHDTTGKLTAEVTGGITFGAQALQIEKAVSVTATYEGEEVEIAVWEWAKAPEEEVLQELTKFDAKHPLEVDVVDKQHPKIKASNQNATKALREAIKKEDDKGIFTNEILKEISFGDEFIEEGKTTKITANYEQKKVEIYVEETESPIITILGKIFTRKNPLRVNVNTHDLGGFDAELYINGITIAIIRESQGRVSAALLYNIKFSGKARWGRISEYTVHSGNLSGTLFILPRFPA